jgi:energy-coupling factor transporter ATP-binding protein EcfA2
MKEKTKFYCTECGNETGKWFGQCPACGRWNTIVEAPAAAQSKSKAGAVKVAGAALLNRPQPITSLDTQEELRFSTGMDELDRVLGGGAVVGSMVLVAGAPGIGKSTLLLQICGLINGMDILYITGEESQRVPQDLPLGQALKKEAQDPGQDRQYGGDLLPSGSGSEKQEHKQDDPHRSGVLQYDRVAGCRQLVGHGVKSRDAGHADRSHEYRRIPLEPVPGRQKIQPDHAARDEIARSVDRQRIPWDHFDEQAAQRKAEGGAQHGRRTLSVQSAIVSRFCHICHSPSFHTDRNKK